MVKEVIRQLKRIGLSLKLPESLVDVQCIRVQNKDRLEELMFQRRLGFCE